MALNKRLAQSQIFAENLPIMIHTLHCDGFSARISDLGAELISLKDLATGKEYIWEADPAIWGSSSPVLFPVVAELKGGIFRHKGQAYRLDKHGFARQSPFELIEDTEDTKRFILRSNEETEAAYPFQFELEVAFQLRAKELQCAYLVRNLSSEPMPFGLGSHPAFALDLNESRLEDYYIEFDQPETLDLYQLEDHLISEHPTKAYLTNAQRLPLSETIFDDDALIFKNIRSQKISICHVEKGPLLRVDRGDCPHLGIWAKPRAPYVCIEPWHSYADSPSHNQELSEKESILTLEPGGQFESAYTIEIA